MTIETLTDLLAERVMRWRVTPSRFMTANRDWIKRKKFQPTARIGDAFRLLEKAAPERCEMGFCTSGPFCVEVRIAGTTGRARHLSKPLAITLAVSRALKIEVDL